MATVAEKYAKALASSAEAAGSLSRIREDFRVFLDMLRSSNDLRFIFISPVYPNDKEIETVNTILEGRVDPLFLKFLGVLIRHNRERHIEEIFRAFIKESDRLQGLIRVHVGSARPVAKSQKDRIAAAVKAASSKEVIVENDTDASLIGGAVLRIGDKIMDFSLASGLENLRKELSKC